MSERSTKKEFNTKASLSLAEKVEILSKTLPDDKRPAFETLRKQHAESAKRLRARQEQQRSAKTQEIYHTELSRVIQSAHNTRGPAPNPSILEENARRSAKHKVALQEGQEMQRHQKRCQEQQYDFLKKTQVKTEQKQSPAATERGAAKESFNAAARPKAFQR